MSFTLSVINREEKSYGFGMKKKYLVLLVAILSLTAIVFTACNRGGEDEKEEISRSVSSFYAGESADFAVSVEVGRREKNFVADGYVTDVSDFVEITVLPLKTNSLTEIEYSLNGESSALSGKLVGNEFGEFSASVEMNFIPLTVSIGEGESADIIELNDVLQGKLTTADVVNIASTAFKDRIEEETAAGNYQREIYVKLITGDRENYYYYVSFIGEGVDYWALLINIDDGSIVTRK